MPHAARRGGNKKHGRNKAIHNYEIVGQGGTDSHSQHDGSPLGRGECARALIILKGATAVRAGRRAKKKKKEKLQKDQAASFVFFFFAHVWWLDVCLLSPSETDADPRATFR